MQIKYLRDASFSSDGVNYFKGEITEVSDEIGNKLVSTFPGFFEVISKQVVQSAAQEVAVTAEPKVVKAPAKK